jgi:hypothetical protein
VVPFDRKLANGKCLSIPMRNRLRWNRLNLPRLLDLADQR